MKLILTLFIIFVRGVFSTFIVDDSSASYYERYIPKIIFRTMKQDLYHLNTMFLLHMNRTAIYNPDYTQVYISDDEMETFVKKFYPQYFDDYDSVVAGEIRSDLARDMLIYLFGGLYLDLDLVLYPSYPLKDLIDHLHDEFVSAVDGPVDLIYTAILGAYQHHPFILKLLERAVYNQHHRYYNCDYLDISGPRMAGRIFKEHLGLQIMDPLAVGRFTVKEEGKGVGGSDHYHLFLHDEKSKFITTMRDQLPSNKGNNNNNYHHHSYNKKVMRDHFEGYYSIMKNSSKEGLRYQEMYVRRMIYRNNNSYLDSRLEGEMIDVQQVKNKARLLPSPNDPRRSFSNRYYMHNGVLRGFPNNEVYYKMGMKSCGADRQEFIKDEMLAHFAYGPIFSTHLTANLLELKVDIPPANLSSTVKTMPPLAPAFEQLLQAEAMRIRRSDDPHLVHMIAPMIVNYTVFITVVDQWLLRNV